MPNPPSADPLLTRRQVAELFGVCTATIDNWAAKVAGFPVPLRPSKRTIRYRAGEVQKFINPGGEQNRD